METKRNLLIVGLGNPGARYAGTRHNAGFLLVDHLVSCFRAEPSDDEGNYLLWKGLGPDGETVYLMKPLTYMNLSGDALARFLSHTPVELNDVLIAYDDISLPVGRMRLRGRGSAGGQKGIKHIIETLGTSDVPRLRIGIDSPLRAGRPLPDFVLEEFAEEETDMVKAVLDLAQQATVFWVQSGMQQAMARFNGNPSHGESDSTVSMNGGA